MILRSAMLVGIGVDRDAKLARSRKALVKPKQEPTNAFRVRAPDRSMGVPQCRVL